MRHTLKILLRGHEKCYLFPLSEEDAGRLYRAVQIEQPETSENCRFIVFDSEDVRVAIRLRAALFAHFLWDPDICAVEAPQPDDSDDSPSQSVHVYFEGRARPMVVGVDPDSDSKGESDDSDLNYIFTMLDTGGVQAHERLQLVDEDGESAFLRAGDIAMLTAPLWALIPEGPDAANDERGT
jgi:hypothetical protein